MTHICILVLVIYCARCFAQDFEPDYFDFDLTTPEFEYTTLDPNSFFPIHSSDSTTTEKAFEEWPLEAKTPLKTENLDSEESFREVTTTRNDDTLVEDKPKDKTDRDDREQDTDEKAITVKTNPTVLIITSTEKSYGDSNQTTVKDEDEKVITEVPPNIFEVEAVTKSDTKDNTTMHTTTTKPESVEENDNEIQITVTEDPSYWITTNINTIHFDEYIPGHSVDESQYSTETLPTNVDEEPEFVFDPSLKIPIPEDPADPISADRNFEFNKQDCGCDPFGTPQTSNSNEDFDDNDNDDETSDGIFKITFNVPKHNLAPTPLPNQFGNSFNLWPRIHIPQSFGASPIDQGDPVEKPMKVFYKHFSSYDDSLPGVIKVTQQEMLPASGRRYKFIPPSTARRVIIPNTYQNQYSSQESFSPHNISPHVYTGHQKDTAAHPIIRNCYHKAKDGPSFMKGDTTYGQVFDGNVYKRCFYCCKYLVNELCYQTDISNCGLKQVEAQSAANGCKVLRIWQNGFFESPIFKVVCS